MNRGEIWLITLDPTIGSEIRKTRPCLVVSPDELNNRLRTIVILPLTTGSRPAPFRVSVTFRRKQGLVLTEQIRAVDKDRLVRRLGRFDGQVLGSVLSRLRETFTD